jgi:glycolate oxidase FAD binding subunit
MPADISFDSVLVDGTSIDRVVEPASVAEAQECVASASSAGQHLLIAGGQTRLAFGNLGGPFDVVLSTRKLNRVLAYEPDDMTMAVEPGCTVRQLRELLETHNQALALDVANDDRATIGGAYATGLSGPRRLAGGSLKDWVIGVEVIGATGAVARAGGMVVKNVTGFDMMHVHYGALGAFGLVTRLNLKVFPRPASARSLRLTFDRLEDAYDAGVTLLRSQLQPSCIMLTNVNGWAVEVRCDAPDSAIARLAQRIQEAAFAVQQPSHVDVDEDGDRALDGFRRVCDLTAGRGVVRLSIPASRQLAPLLALDAAGGQDVCADFGSGLVYVAGEANAAWQATIERIEPVPTYLALPPEWKAGRDVFGASSMPAQAVTRRLKQTFDPDGLFNRGRFALGL